MKIKNKFTWNDLKKVANSVPEHLLKNQVTIWAEDGEKGYTVVCVETLKEDYIFDGDEGCCPKKAFIESSLEDEDFDADEHYVVHEKGTRIIHAE